MNLDDPKLTAFALGELDEPGRTQVADALERDGKARREVADTRRLAETLVSELRRHRLESSRAERDALLEAVNRERKMVRFPPPVVKWGIRIGFAAACVAIGAFYALSPAIVRRETPTVARETPRIVFEPTPIPWDLLSAEERSRRMRDASPAATAARAWVPDIPAIATPKIAGAASDFRSASLEPVSTFPLHTESGSFSSVRRHLDAGRLPPKDAVRIAELVNHFRYRYSAPEAGQPVGIDVELTVAPWNPAHCLARIGIVARESRAGRIAVANDARIEVAFDPDKVGTYRLIGYEHRTPKGDTATGARADGETFEADDQITALYEITPSGEPPRRGADDEWLTVRFRYREPEGGERRVLAARVGGRIRPIADASSETRFAAAAAEFGMLLRDSPHRGSATFPQVLDLAHGEGNAEPTADDRRELVALVRKAQTLRERRG